MKIFSLLIAVLLCAGCAHSDPWTKTDTALYMGYVGTLAYDSHTTGEIQNYPCLEEGGWLASRVIGRQPSASDSAQYFATLAISSYFIARALPRDYRKMYLGVGVGVHGVSAKNNDELFDRGCQ